MPLHRVEAEWGLVVIARSTPDGDQLIGEIVDEDGKYCYQPVDDCTLHTAADLRIIADILEAENKK